MKSFNQFIKSRDKSLYREFSEMARLNTTTHITQMDQDNASRHKAGIVTLINTIEHTLGNDTKDIIPQLRYLAILPDDENFKDVDRNIIEPLHRFSNAFVQHFDKNSLEDQSMMIRSVDQIISELSKSRSFKNDALSRNRTIGRFDDKAYLNALKRFIQDPLEKIEMVLKKHISNMDNQRGQNELNPADMPEM